MVRILTQEEAAKDGLEEAGERTETGVDGETAQDSDGRIDLNLATAAELMTLSESVRPRRTVLSVTVRKMVLFLLWRKSSR